jgi:hypothetical protein
MKTKNLALFEKYYNDEMDPEARKAFEESLSSDPELNASFREYLSIYEAINDKDALDLRIKLRELREENSKGGNVSDFFMQGYNWVWVAALLVVIISFSVILSLLVTNIERHKELMAKATEVQPTTIGPLDREIMRFEQRHSDFNLAMPDDPIIYINKETLEFQWTVTTTESLMLELINWDGNIIYSSGKSVISPYVVKANLPAGSVVFRFRSETESYHLGILFIK